MYRASSLKIAAGLLVVAALIGGVLTLSGVQGHDGHQEKKLFTQRYYQQVSGDNYEGWMNLTTSGPFAVSCIDVNACGSRWDPVIDAATADWNSQPTTVKIVSQGDYNENYDLNFEVTDFILGNPFILGLAAPFDVTYEFCFEDPNCVIFYGWALLGDAAHILEYDTPGARQGTVAARGRSPLCAAPRKR